jgi:hypothetical protein
LPLQADRGYFHASTTTVDDLDNAVALANFIMDVRFDLDLFWDAAITPEQQEGFRDFQPSTSKKIQSSRASLELHQKCGAVRLPDLARMHAHEYAGWSSEPNFKSFGVSRARKQVEYQ